MSSDIYGQLNFAFFLSQSLEKGRNQRRQRQGIWLSLRPETLETGQARVLYGTEFKLRVLEIGPIARCAARLHSTGETRGRSCIDSFNGRLGDKCVNVHQFASLANAQFTIEAWCVDYNIRRLDSSHGYLTLSELLMAWFRKGDGDGSSNTSTKESNDFS